MNALAFDTSTAACAVALRRADGELFEVRPPASRLIERPAHTTELLPAILELTGRAGISLGQVESLAVGIGPGAFTGLRIGVATARAIATANQIDLVAVSSLAALGIGGQTPVIDARRSELYFRTNGVDQLAGPEEAIDRIAVAESIAVGDGALKYRNELGAAGVAVAPPDDELHVVSAAAILELSDALPAHRPDEVVPNYIRPPDAKVSSRESWLVGPAK
ncbi:MAG: tRNA (adenosine(37)-N6)-threonylcarbamoyltransferase complex dimerization subunit type 1 TsaB [Solirubrobacterales bacterium]